MRVLAFDTALAACSAAVWADGRTLAARQVPMPRGQSEALVPMLAEVMAAAGLAFAAVERIAVTVGPGAFTGIRIGLATARGLALALGVPAVGVTTPEAVAHGLDATVRGGRTVVVALESGRPDLYLQLFAPDLAPLGPVTAAGPEAAAGLVPAGPVTLAGTGAARLAAALAPQARANLSFAPGPGLPDPGVVAALAAGRDVPAAPPAPVYVHPPYAKLPAASKRR